MIALGILANVADATPALDKPAFTASPAELLAVAKAAPRTATDVIVLREDNDLSYDERGRLTSRWRMVFVVVTQDGAKDWNVLSTTWLPAYQDRPTVRARVIRRVAASSSIRSASAIRRWATRRGRARGTGACLRFRCRR